jgi:cell division protein FtsQ
VQRWLASAWGAARWTFVWGLAVGMFFLVTVFAGLFSGGHVSTGLAWLRGAGEGAMAGAGFTVQAVTLEGRSETAQREIARMLGIKRGDLMLYVDVDEARARIEALPWVKSAEVRRIWPDRIQVRIVERTPVAVWQMDGAKTVIDSDGHPIAGENPERFATLPLVVGQGAETAVASLLKLVATQPNLKSRVKIAVRVGERRWDLQLDNAVEVRLPEEGAEAALAELVRLDREQNVLSRDIKAIDLRYPDRFIVKLPPRSPLISPARPAGGRET